MGFRWTPGGMVQIKSNGFTGLNLPSSGSSLVSESSCLSVVLLFVAEW